METLDGSPNHRGFSSSYHATRLFVHSESLGSLRALSRAGAGRMAALLFFQLFVFHYKEHCFMGLWGVLFLWVSLLIVLSSKIPFLLSLPRVVLYHSITTTSSSSPFFCLCFLFLPCQFVSPLPCYSQNIRQKVAAIIGNYNGGPGLIVRCSFFSFIALGT